MPYPVPHEIYAFCFYTIAFLWILKSINGGGRSRRFLQDHLGTHADMLKRLVQLLTLVTVIRLAKAKCVPKPHPEYYDFPPNFKWSVATSAFQVEGATAEHGRGPSIWDEFSKKPGKIRDNSTADISSDSYHKYRDDIKLMKSLGVSHYRFSISWSRLFPTGMVSTPNRDGVHYYHNIIDVLIENNIEPMVTLYHWDLPLALQDAGGWLNREIVKWFRLYAVFCFKEYGDKVKYWITFNEAAQQSTLGYCGFSREHAPGGFQEHCHWAQYLAGHHMLLAHAHAYRAYHALLPGRKGKVGITNSMNWVEPESEAESEFAEEVRQWQTAWFIHPFFNGEYPPAMRRSVDKNSKAEGRTASRLPRFSAYEKSVLIGAVDFLGVNYYRTTVARRFRPGEKDVRKAAGYDIDGVSHLSKQDMPVGDKNSWLRSHPAGFRAVLNYIRENYNNPEVFITENGCMDTPGESLADITRMRYLREHIAAVSQAIVDGCNVVGYTLWSLLDNFEWSEGYTSLFGIYKVDFTSHSRPRTPKHSAKLYADIIRNNSVALIEDCVWDI